MKQYIQILDDIVDSYGFADTVRLKNPGNPGKNPPPPAPAPSRPTQVFKPDAPHKVDPKSIGVLNNASIGERLAGAGGKLKNALPAIGVTTGLVGLGLGAREIARRIKPKPTGIIDRAKSGWKRIVDGFKKKPRLKLPGIPKFRNPFKKEKSLFS